MSKEKKVLFGVDNSQFAREAIAATGGLLKNNENFKIIIFHGIPEPDLSHLSKARLSPEAVEKYPDLVKKYMGSVVPASDNYYAALNTAAFSDGSFVYIPKNTKCPFGERIEVN